MLAVLKGWGLGANIGVAAAQGGADLKLMLWMGYQASGVLFFGLVATLYVVRKRPTSAGPDRSQGLAALMGSYMMMPVALSASAD